MDMRQTEELTRLEQSLDHIREAPADGGTVELIAIRPAVDEREILTEARLDPEEGLIGDSWRVRLRSLRHMARLHCRNTRSGVRRLGRSDFSAQKY